MAPIKGKCEWPQGCKRQGLLYEFDNALGQRVRHFFCKRHKALMQHPEQREELLRRLLTARQAVLEGSARVAGQEPVPPEELLDHDVQVALLQHQERCEACGAARQWIANEMAAGRIRTAEDTHRIGEYVMAHCCPLGIYLQERLGKIMAGLG